MTINTDLFVLYILMRNDLPSMNVGRAAAQASHASNAFIYDFGKRKEVKIWQSYTSQGFGTAIVLSASRGDIQNVLDIADTIALPIGWVIDPEYGMPVSEEIYPMISKSVQIKEAVRKPDGTVIVFREEKTCAYVFGLKSEMTQILGHLPLFPEKPIV